MTIDGGIRIGVVARPEMSPEELPRVAQAVEETGIDDLWLWEDSFWAGGLVAAATALGATASLRVGLGVMPTPFRSPALAAMEVAALARLHPGRFVPGFGHGVREWMKQVGAAPKSPLGLMEEYVPAVRALLRGEEVSVSGDYVNLDRVRLEHPPAATVPPVLVGANGPKAFALAGRLADGVVLGGVPDPQAAAEAVTAVRAARAGSPRAGELLHAVGYVDLAADPVPQAQELMAAGLTTIVYAPRRSAPDPRSLLKAVAAVRASLA